MNHLAHAFLAGDSPESLIGNIAGDFFKGRVEHHDVRLREGIRQHRTVDAFTDAHPAVLASKRRIAQIHGHYSGIIVDVFYDHLLASSWDRYRNEPLETFARRVYRTLASHPDLIPAAFAASLPRMIADDWLVRYRSVDGVSRALWYLGRRLRGNPNLESAVQLLAKHRRPLEDDFETFFPQLIGLKNSELRIQNSE